MAGIVRWLVTGMLLATLAACGGGRPNGIPKGFDDVQPNDWRGSTKPSHYDVHGIDASRFQGAIDFDSAARGGVGFAFLKATEGGDFADPMFPTNHEAARRAGVPVGAYHFYYYCRTAEEQAQWFIDHVPATPGDLPPVLDMEWNGHSETCKLRPPPETVRSEAHIFLDRLTAHYGKKPIIYTSIDFWEQNEMWKLGEYQFWLRSVAGHPDDVYGDRHHWTFWQYTGTGRAPGVDGAVDLNTFNGSSRQWRKWLEAHSQ